MSFSVILYKPLTVILYFLVINSVICHLNKSDIEKYNNDVYRNFMDMELQFKRLIDKAVKSSLPLVMEAQEHMNLSSTCVRNTFHLVNGMRKLKKWALSFLDSAGKPQSGIMYLNAHMLGDPEQCLNITVAKDSSLNFRGQYCLVKFKPLLPVFEDKVTLKNRKKMLVKFHPRKSNASEFFQEAFAPVAGMLYFEAYLKFGICVPSGCTENDVSQYVKYASEKLFLDAKVDFCITEENDKFWTKSRITVTCIFVFFGMLMVIGTLTEYILKEEKDNYLAIRILKCFSLITNFSKLVSTKTSEKNLTSLNGIRSLAAFWVVLAHEYVFFLHSGNANHSVHFEVMMKSFFPQIIFNGFFSVDVFFFISGFLNSYMRTKIKNSDKKQPSIFMIMIHRLWRIYPAMIACLLLFLLMKFGILYTTDVNEYLDTCKHAWWKTFLFVNNFYHPTNVCLHQTWYLAADMQLFLMSLFTVPVLLRNRKVGVALNVCLILLVSAFCFAYWWIFHLPPAVDLNNPSIDELVDFGLTYNNPLVHFGAYFTGIMLGYFIAIKQEMKIPKRMQIIGWLCSSFLCLSMLFITKRWSSGIEPSQWESSFYGAFSKTLFSVGLAWMVFCCVTGNGGFAQYILSFKVWIPIARISYMLYLISPLIQIFYHTSSPFPSEFTTINMVVSFLGNLGLSLLVAFVLVLLIEFPVVRLERTLLHRTLEKEKSVVNTKL